MTNEFARRLNSLRETLSSFINSPQAQIFNQPDSYDPVEYPLQICDSLEFLSKSLFPNTPNYRYLCPFADYASIPEYLLVEIDQQLDIVSSEYPEYRDFYFENIFIPISRFLE